MEIELGSHFFPSNLLRFSFIFMCTYAYECVRFSRAGVTGACESPFGCWESNSGPRQKQYIHLTAEPSLQPLHQGLKNARQAL